MNIRNRAQVMGYWLNEPALQDHRKIQAAMEDLGRSGYGIVRIMLRNTNYSHRSPEVVQAVRAAVESGHAHGLKVVLDTEPHADPVAHDLGQSFPEATVIRLLRVQTKIVNGTFQLRFIPPHVYAAQPIFDGVESAFVRTGDGVRKIELPAFDLVWEISVYPNDVAAEQDYVFGRPGRQTRNAKLSGRLDLPEGTELAVYVRVRDLRGLDFWAEGFLRYYESLLDCYRDVPLDGVGWDEPAFGGDWTHYRWGAGIAAAFAKMKGYRLADKLWLLDEGGLTPESARVRLDYYHVLNEGVAQAQAHVIAYARQLFGPDIILGTHHTWHGEGNINDYRAGAVDYFRLTDPMDAGYTDCCWWDLDSVCYAYNLGSSLGRLTASGETEVNTWHWKPTNAQVQYHVRLMTLMDITWFNIWYGEDTDTCRYPSHYTWPQTVASMRTHRDYQARLAGAKPVVETAIWHGWEGVVAINRADIAAAHKAFCLNTSRLFMERNVPFDFVDSRLLEKGEVKDGKLATTLGSYRVLVLPYATVLPRAAWKTCREFANQGGKVILVGPPPVMDTDGQPLDTEFAQWLDLPGVPLAGYLAAMDLAGPLPVNRPARLDLTYPLTGDSTRIRVSVEGEPHAVVSPGGNVVYMTDLDPRLRLLAQVEQWTRPEVECLSDSIQWRHYRSAEGSVIVCIARKDRSMRGLLRFAGSEIEIRSGTLAFIRERGGKIEVQGEDLDVSVRAIKT